ncbi:MAG TPA: TonB-dependent receptor [Pyrinomonadaceae bacterium]
MHRKNLLRWTSIIVVACFLTLAFFNMSQRSTTQAAGQDKQQSPGGSLQVFDQQGKPAGACPLKHTSVKAEVSGFLSRVTVTQEFHNPFTDKIEAVYKFPLPQSAAIDDMTMHVGERTIKGKIMRREEAQQTYSTARAMGQTAALLDQERPNIFTQAVANIMPGEEIQITISYVETLKYENGSYEWTFPMVVGERYMPATTEESPAQTQPADANNPGEYSHPRTNQDINPPVTPDGTRVGHDISLEISIDAGVPIEDLKSETHETDIERSLPNRAIVRLKDQDVIPNKDFVLRYKVAGEKIEDAVLAHRDEKGGYFTLILQPPQKIVAEDVMPKELVFVLDTSGSMGGFPLDKAKETMLLALDNLYPHDTFNVITFSGDTHVLFSDPVPATPQNIKKAKHFLETRESDGGTEMMKAIEAALDSSDAQDHLRIACFMTDGQVGNDLEIISQVQKHKKARVFAIGFGAAPNRFLLDKMAEYGRGEVDYVSETGDTSDLAKRFNERVRNPLLTDISVDWTTLPVTDVYPRQIPDLFGAKPVILSGRYTQGGSGTIRLKGKIAGQDFVREIPVQLPEQEPTHDVLSTLWARRRIDDLMGQDMNGAQYGTMTKELTDQITQLGLDFKLMTQFTSFVAIDEVVYKPGGDPKRVDVPTSTAVATGGINEMVTVTSGSNLVSYSADTTLSSVITTHTIQNLPLAGRNLSNLALIAPGTVATVNGNRGPQNNLLIDGIDTNFSIQPGGQNPGASAAGTSVGLTAAGGANNLAPQSGTAEVDINTNNVAAEYGRNVGPVVNIVTKSGTNAFHGSLFEYFGNDKFDATDWFANSRGLRQPARRLNNFGGTFDGPLQKNRIFFFGSYEGLRLRQPLTAITETPSLSSRLAAPANVRPFLSAFPIANGSEGTDGLAEFASSFSNPAKHDAFTFRVDSNLNRLTLNGRYAFAESESQQRGSGGFSLNTINSIRSLSQTLTGSALYTLSPATTLEVRANYSRLTSVGSFRLDNFGGAQVPAEFGPAFTFDLNGRNTRLMTGDETSSTQRVVNLVGSLSSLSGPHSFKFGAEYRKVMPLIGLRPLERGVLFDGVNQALTGVATRLNEFDRLTQQSPGFNNLGLYAQDDWKLNNHFTLNYGLRWNLNPAPANHNLLAVNQIEDVANLQLATPGRSLWKTTYANFAPRLGFVFNPTGNNSPSLVFRGGIGINYNAGQEAAGEAFANSYPILTGNSIFNVPFSTSVFPLANSQTLPLFVFDPNLKLPYTINWSLSMQKSLGATQSISLSYLEAHGRRLLNTQTLLNQNADFPFIRLTSNGASSDYRALQVMFERQLAANFDAYVSYSLARTFDNASDDSAANAFISNLANDRGPSDLDFRHVLHGLASYRIPSSFASGLENKLLRNWTFSSIFEAHSGRPLNVVYAFPTSFGFAYVRPNAISGVPVYLFDQNAAGGRRLNPAAFEIPAGLQQGNLGRNALRGFPLYQVDLALHRKFDFTESVGLVFQVDAFNLLNHPNFEDPLLNDLSLGTRVDPNGSFRPNLTFGQSASLAGMSVLNGGAFGAFNGNGGARTLRMSVKLMF